MHRTTRPPSFLRLCTVFLALALAGCADQVSSPQGGGDASDTSTTLDVRDSSPSGGACRDGKVDPGEQCDPLAQATYRCNVFGAGSGDANCTPDCALDLSQCSNPPDTCGNNLVDIGEACDGADLGGRTCQGQGFDSGTLACRASCQLDTSGCIGGASGCGNNVREAGEACDGGDLGGASCTTAGDFVSGTLACSATCSFDTSACVQPCGNGVLDPGELCDDGNRVDDLTCSADCSAACGVGAGECSGATSRYCVGGQVVTETCDPLIGETCSPQTGRCSSPCSPEALGRSYVGCDYFPTVTANLVDSRWTFAVAVSNTSTEAATVTVTRGDQVVTTASVAARSVAVVALPWVSELKGPSSLSVVPFPASIHVADGAYRLRSTRPVTVYQFNPLEYTDGGNCGADQSRCTYTNDASLLLPTHVWGREYFVAARHHFFDSSGLLAVTAVEDGTTVTLTPPGGTGSFRAGIAGIGTNGAGTVTMNAGDVVQLVTDAGGDPTGVRVSSDKPIQVIGGHQCTYVPDDVAACDHLEESIFPLETLSPRYLVTAPMSPGGGGPKAQVVRIVATEPNTTLTYDPPQPDAPTTIANAGGWFELSPRATDFFVTASAPVLVARYMQGQDAGAASGDPAMATAVNTSQFRDDYLFHAPTNYEENWVNITAPAGASVQLDGAEVTDWTAVGSSGFQVARRQLSNSGDGNHSVTATAPVGITVYGYGQYTSYWYPGGLNLEIIN